MRTSAVLTLLLAGVLTFGATSARGQGGTCPSNAQYINPANPTGPLVTLASLGVTSCFYVAANGSDSNDGKSEASGHPWLHAPDMPAATGNPAAHTPAPGEGYVFRGGDVWHYFSGTPLIGLPSGYPHGTNGYAWRWTQSGTATNPIYIGVDQTWFAGSSWTRPVITEDNPIFTPSAPNPTLLDSTAVASCAFPSGNLDAIAFTGPTFYIFDNFEFTGMCWNDQTDGGNGTNEHSYIKQFQGGGTGSSPRWFFNNYGHGWSHTRFSCNSITTSALGSGGSGYAVNDTFGIASPGVAGLFALGHVTSVSSGVVTGYTITDIGTGFGTGVQATTRMGSQPGSGSGLTINITAVSTITCSGPQMFNGSTQQANFGAVYAFNVVDGSDSDDLTFTATWGDAYDIEENVIRHVGGTNITSNCHSVHDNLYEFINNGNDGVGHMDLLFCVAEANVAGGNFNYNNLLRFIGTRYNQASLSAVFWFGGVPTGSLCGGVTCVDYIFNNSWHDINAQGNYINIGGNATGIGPPETGVVNFKVYNNTIEMLEFIGGGGFSPAFENGAGNAPNMLFTSQNNHWIIPNGATGNCAAAFSSTTNVNGGVTSCSGDVFQTLSAANAQGYTSSNDFAMISNTGATFGSGANETPLVSTFGPAFALTTSGGVTEGPNHTSVFPARSLFTRPTSGPCPGVGCWNAGAFNFIPSTVTLTPATYAFAPTGIGSNSGDSPVAFTLTNNTGVTVTGVAISFSGVNAGDFSNTTSCATTLASSARLPDFRYLRADGNGNANSDIDSLGF
ncbi:MAG TPA: hypothetical protein VN881_10860 [Candidatus Acidoferrales bacterium]|nr:hypothetical protein [Candidatus Acidoferrales bacterium]